MLCNRETDDTPFRQPGHLRETRSFAPLSCDEFAFIKDGLIVLHTGGVVTHLAPSLPSAVMLARGACWCNVIAGRCEIPVAESIAQTGYFSLPVVRGAPYGAGAFHCKRRTSSQQVTMTLTIEMLRFPTYGTL